MTPGELLSGAAHDVAVSLLGARLTSHLAGGTVAVRIVEVEAYDQTDPASHTFCGPTQRNRVMFGPAGHAYVYRSHGIHACMNVVCGRVGEGAAVLLRGGEVIAGRALASQRRGGRDDDGWLAAGPGRLCQALAVTPGEGGAWLLGEGPLKLELEPQPGTRRVHRGPRVGVSKGADVAWRFWLESDAVSNYRRSPRASG